MAKIVQLTFVCAILLAIASQTFAIKCYDCSIPTAECFTDYQSKVKDCNNDLISQGVSAFTGKKPVCVKLQQGEYFKAMI